MKPVFESVEDSRAKTVEEDLESPKMTDVNIIKTSEFKKSIQNASNESFSSLEEDHPLNFIHPTEKVTLPLADINSAEI